MNRAGTSPDGAADLGAEEFTRLQNAARRRRAYPAAKRLLDIGGAGLCLLLASPLMLLTAIAVRASSPGPVFYGSPRYGLRGRRFTMLKFRSMRSTAMGDSAAPPVAADGSIAKRADDPRVTTVGRWIRRCSIDELPQLLNVLRGDMSLVGPRPVVSEMLEPYPVFNRARALVRPGITGLWQVRDRAHNTHIHYMWRHDLEYVQGCSLWLDLRIAASTLGVVLGGKGAV